MLDGDAQVFSFSNDVKEVSRRAGASRHHGLTPNVPAGVVDCCALSLIPSPRRPIALAGTLAHVAAIHLPTAIVPVLKTVVVS
jgi:hypothetical protein